MTPRAPSRRGHGLGPLAILAPLIACGAFAAFAACGSSDAEGTPGTDPDDARSEGGALRRDGATADPPPDGSPATATAFFHLGALPGDKRTWLLTPTGERTFVVGLNTVMREPLEGKLSQCEGIGSYIRRLPPTRAANIEWARLGTGDSQGEHVDAPYCFNSVGAFTETNNFDDTPGDSYMVRSVATGGAAAPYGVVLSVGATAVAHALRNESGAALVQGFSDVRVGDPFNPAFAADVDSMVARQVLPRKNEANLVTWYTGNEIGMWDRASHDGIGVRDYRHWLWSACPPGSTIDAPACTPHALAAFLRAKYTTLPALNAAWTSAYVGATFLAVVEGAAPRPVPYVHDCSETCRRDLQIFVHDVLLRKWIDLVTTKVREADPNHLIGSPRFAVTGSSAYRFFAEAKEATPDVWFDTPAVPVPNDGSGAIYTPFDLFARKGLAGFDLVALNVYTAESTFESPWFDTGLARIHALTGGLPIMISEFGIRTRIDGWSNKGGAGTFVPNDDATDDQVQRGARYRTQMTQFTSFPYVVGANFHAWSDRYMPADETHQINLGVVKCDDPLRKMSAGERWASLDVRVAETNCGILDLIRSSTGY